MALLSLTLGFLAGCGLRDVMPGPPAVGPAEHRTFTLGEPARTAQGPVAYSSAPVVDHPVLPLQVWGLRYALDVVLVSDHPDWVMHEYARIDLPDRSFWLAKDAGRDREQTITADLPELAAWVPEAPVRRHTAPLEVTDRSSATEADLRFVYTNPLGQPMDVHYVGPLPTRPSNPRNGNTMGHSRGTVAALLDLYLFRIGGRAEVRIDGAPRALHRLAGLVPEAYLLAQVQGGVAVTDFCETGDGAGGFTLRRPCGAADWPTAATESWVPKDGWIERAGPVVTLRYHFTPAGELDSAEAVQVGSPTPLVHFTFDPAIPDVRRRFAGEAVSRFVADVNGQPGHGVGCVVSRWNDDVVEVDFLPTAPRWFADRPIRTTVRYALDEAGRVSPRVHADRRDLPLEPPCGR